MPYRVADNVTRSSNGVEVTTIYWSDGTVTWETIRVDGKVIRPV
jgi:hypothetical protein